MYNILYVNNLMFEDILIKRNNYKLYAQAANNKILGITKGLQLNNCKVINISQGLMNNKTFKFYEGFRSEINENTYYASIVDIPFFYFIWSILATIKLIIKLNKKYKFDYIIFYNYRPVVSIPALFAKIILKIKIIVDYEDGDFALDSLNKVKKCVFNLSEKIVSKFIDGAILVTSNLIFRVKEKKYIVIRGLINESLYNKSLNNKKNDNKIPRLLYCGGLDEERGIKILLNSLKYLDSECIVTIAGKGPLTEYVSSYKDDRINFLGYLKDYEQIEELMLNSDILINPQVSNNHFGKYCFPSKVYEYISARKIIVSSDVSDINKLEDLPILIYKNDDPRELSAQLKKSIGLFNNGKSNIQYTQFIDRNLPIEVGKKIIEELF